MHRGNWRKRIAFGLVALLTVPLAIYSATHLLTANNTQASIERQADRTAQEQHRQGADEMKRRCLDADPAERIECEHQATQATDSAEREIRDLEAQQIMALWTRYIGAAAIIGITVSVVGVLLVFVTFWQTRRQANIAQQAMMLSMRPWIDVELVAEWVSPEQTQLVVGFHAKLKNIGHSPARRVTAVFFDFADSLLYREGFGHDLDRAFPENGETEDTILPGGQTTVEDIALLPWGDNATINDERVYFDPNDGINPIILARVQYEIADGQYGETARSFMLGWPDKEMPESRGLIPICLGDDRTRRDLRAEPYQHEKAD